MSVPNQKPNWQRASHSLGGRMVWLWVKSTWSIVCVSLREMLFSSARAAWRQNWFKTKNRASLPGSLSLNTQHRIDNQKWVWIDLWQTHKCFNPGLHVSELRGRRESLSHWAKVAGYLNGGHKYQRGDANWVWRATGNVNIYLSAQIEAAHVSHPTTDSVLFSPLNGSQFLWDCPFKGTQRSLNGCRCGELFCAGASWPQCTIWYCGPQKHTLLQRWELQLLKTNKKNPDFKDLYQSKPHSKDFHVYLFLFAQRAEHCKGTFRWVGSFCLTQMNQGYIGLVSTLIRGPCKWKKFLRTNDLLLLCLKRACGVL